MCLFQSSLVHKNAMIDLKPKPSNISCEPGFLRDPPGRTGRRPCRGSPTSLCGERTSSSTSCLREKIRKVTFQQKYFIQFSKNEK